MKQQAQTWDGLWFAFRESAQNAFRKIGTPLLKALKPSLDSAIKLLGTMEPDFTKWGEKLGGTIEEGLTAVKKFFDSSDKSIFEKFAQLLADVTASAVGKGLKSALDSWATDVATVVQRDIAPHVVMDKGLLTPASYDRPPIVRGADKGLQDRLRAGPNMREGKFTGRSAQSWLPQLRPLADMIASRTGTRLATGGVASGGLGAGLTEFKSKKLAAKEGYSFPFSSRLDDPAKRTTSLLGYRERRQMDMSRRAEVAARLGGREQGDTRIRRGDRKRMQDIQKENIRAKTGVERTNQLLEKLESKFTEAWLTGGN